MSKIEKRIGIYLSKRIHMILFSSFSSIFTLVVHPTFAPLKANQGGMHRRQRGLIVSDSRCNPGSQVGRGRLKIDTWTCEPGSMNQIF